jgi:dihydrofolate reductase
MTRISIIVAMDENGLIGAGNQLPWRLPNDLKFFKRTTMGKPVLMGRKTWESLGKPLPGRQNLVMSRHPDFHPEGAKIVRTLEGALRLAEADGFEEIMVIGGAQVYALVLPRADRIYLTRVHAHLQGDTWFPALDWNEWRRESSEPQPADEKNAYPHSFELWRRLPVAA